MENKEKRQELLAPQKKKPKAVSSSDEDSDVEKNFTLFSKRGSAEEELYVGEEDFSPDDEEDRSEEEEEEGESSGGDEGPEEAGGSSLIQTTDDMKNELSNMSFEDIMKLQNKVGTKVYNQVAHGNSRSREKLTKKRQNKNRPTEVSAKRPAPFLRQVVAVRKPTFRDPRFDDLSGEYKAEIFNETYRFINDIKHREKEMVKKKMKKMKNNKSKEKLQLLLKRMEDQEKTRKSQEAQRERELQFKRQQRERANQGERPFFLKKSEKKKLQLVDKYEELKKSGKLQNFLSRKRKRNAGKDRRKLPKLLQSKS